MSNFTSRLTVISKTTLPGVVSAVGMFAILSAKHWVALSTGWTVLAVFLVLLVIGRLREHSPDGSLRFELGPPIVQFPNSIQTGMRPLGVIVILLGLAGLVFPSGSELGVPYKYGGGLFLIGAGVGCLAIYKSNRFCLTAGYALWAIAGVVMATTATLFLDDLFAVAKAVTVGVLMTFGGCAAAYFFRYGKTRVFEDGILIGTTLCHWNHVDRWDIEESGSEMRLQLFVADGKWKPAFWVRCQDIASLREFLKEKVA